MPSDHNTYSTFTWSFPVMEGFDEDTRVFMQGRQGRKERIKSRAKPSQIKQAHKPKSPLKQTARQRQAR